MRKLERRLRNEAEQCILTAAKLISSAAGEESAQITEAYDWYGPQDGLGTSRMERIARASAGIEQFDLLSRACRLGRMLCLYVYLGRMLIFMYMANERPARCKRS